MTLHKHEYIIISSMAQTKEKLDTLVLRNICMRTVSVTVMVSIPKVSFRKLLDISYVKSSFSKIITHIDNGIWKIPYNWIFYGHESSEDVWELSFAQYPNQLFEKHCPKIFHLLLFLFFFQINLAAKFNLVLIKWFSPQSV